MKQTSLTLTPLSPTIKDLIVEILRSGSVVIRDVDNGEEAFLYSSGNYGPGYVSIKNLVGRRNLLKKLCQQLALKIAQEGYPIDFVAANVTGGVVPGWEVADYLGQFMSKDIQYFYVRDTRKLGGLKELTTGTFKNPAIEAGMTGIVIEELVNFAETTTNSALYLREQKNFKVDNAGCILFYNNPESVKKLEENNITMTPLFTLSQLLDVAEEYKCFPSRLIDSYRNFLDDPLEWQRKRNLKPQKSGTK